MASPIFQRTWEIAVDTTRYVGIRVQFQVERSLKPEPNTTEVKLYNLTADQRRRITQSKTPQVRLAAGYKQTGLASIFLGNLVLVQHAIDGPDIITTISAGDGTKEIKTARAKLSFGSGTRTDVVLQALAASLGVKPGNVQAAAAKLRTGRAASIYLEGTIMSGPTAREINHLCRSAGFEWSIQDGALQILENGAALAGLATRLDSTSGLVGSPTVDTKGKVKCKSLILPSLTPGRVIDLRSKFVSGQYRIEKVQFQGDTHDTDWYAEIEAGPTASQLILDKQNQRHR